MLASAVAPPTAFAVASSLVASSAILGVLLVAALVLGRATRALARSAARKSGVPRAASVRLLSIEIEQPPAYEPSPSPPPSPPPRAGQYGAFDFHVSSEDLAQLLLDDDDDMTARELPPAEEEPRVGTGSMMHDDISMLPTSRFEPWKFGSCDSLHSQTTPSSLNVTPWLLSKYQYDGIPLHCEGASAQEDSSPPESHSNAPPATLCTERHGVKRSICQLADAPDMCSSLKRSTPAAPAQESLWLAPSSADDADEPLFLAEAEELLCAVIDAEVNEAQNCWDAAPPDAQPPADESAFVLEPPRAKRAQPPAGDSPASSSRSDFVEGGSSFRPDAQPPAFDSPCWSDQRSAPATSPVPGDAHAGQPQPQRQPTPPVGVPSCAPALAAFGAHLELAQRLQALSTTALPSQQQLQSLLAAGVDPSLVQQLHQLAQLAHLARMGGMGTGTGMGGGGALAGGPTLLPLVSGSDALGAHHARAPAAHLPAAFGAPAIAALPSQPPSSLQMQSQMQAVQCMQHPHLLRPSASESAQLLQLWTAHAEEVAAAVEQRKATQQFERRSHRHFCQGCGCSKAGHRRSEVHSKCVDAVCWCGVKRMLHPYPLAAGARCTGEWRDIVLRHCPHLAFQTRPQGTQPQPPPPLVPIKAEILAGHAH